MKILHLIGTGATRREREQQHLDALHLQGVRIITADLAEKDGKIAARDAAAQLVHVYGPPPFALLKDMRARWIGNAEPPRTSIPWRRLPFPALPPGELLEINESVDTEWLQDAPPARRPASVASLQGESRSAMRRDVLARLARIRGDVEWTELRRPPASADAWRWALWVDIAEEDDGGALEAIASGRLSVAVRTPRNLQRSAGGAAAILVPPADPNEIAHAILKALFKPETAVATIDQMRRQRSRFDPAQRADALMRLYDRIIS